ncbi:uncharacterized protein A4U43_C08F5630 [Asparagus officinalis]|uniref:inactive protein RESTRICTED TEV MOVEMENT 2-like n=1 Tax=Asparagus officinalis TaxID=4686 RepID=UPI00098E620D|nr:inactive protein RESTRICTED TEV MOVEMENT 2-like [Asparagus officinalis]ONK59359.1 uncharacterized protein A4U43_C08F5630 [Asparagus officinalis]
MDKLRSRRPTFKGQPSATREDFKPEVQWFEDPSERKLIMQLTGFKREEIRVTLDTAGKLLVKASSQVTDNKYLDVDQTFDIPKDTIIEKISGKFEDGRLTLTLPKRAVEKHESTPEATTEEKKKESIQEEKKEEEVPQKETPTTKQERDEPVRERESIEDEKKEEEATQKQAKADKEEKDEAVEEKPDSLEERKDEQMPEEKPTKAFEEKLSELTQKETPKPEDDKKEEGHVLKEKLENGEEKKDEPAGKEKSESFKEKKEEDSIQKETVMPSSMEKERAQKTMQKMKSKIMEICADKPKEIIKRISIWTGGEDGRLDSGSVDGILEKLNRNRKVIVVAIAAFSVGFYVSQKLRTSGR